MSSLNPLAVAILAGLVIGGVIAGFQIAGARADKALAEAKARTEQLESDVEEAQRHTAAAVEKADSLGDVADSAVARARATVIPPRPSRPPSLDIGAPVTDLREGLWIAYSDSIEELVDTLEVKIERQDSAIVALEAQVHVYEFQVIPGLHHQLSLKDRLLEEHREMIAAQAVKLNPPFWQRAAWKAGEIAATIGGWELIQAAGR